MSDMKPAWLREAEVAEMDHLMKFVQRERSAFHDAKAVLVQSVPPSAPVASTPQSTKPHSHVMLGGKEFEYHSHVSGRSVKAVRQPSGSNPTVCRTDASPAAAASRVRRLSQSVYVQSRRASSSYPLLEPEHHNDDVKHVLPKLPCADAGPDFVGTVIVSTGAVSEVSAVVRSHGALLGTAVHGEDVSLRVRISARVYAAFVSDLEECTGKDFALQRDAVPGPSLSRPASGDMKFDRVQTPPVLSKRSSTAAPGLCGSTVAGVQVVEPKPPASAEENRHVARQVKEALRAKAGMLLLQAAESGATFMLHKLLDKGLPMPKLQVLSFSLGSILSDDLEHLNIVNNDPDCERVTADVNVTDEQGRSALMIAAYLGHAVFVEKLLEHGAVLKKHNWEGETAFECARKGLKHARDACVRGIEGATVWKAGCSAVMRALDDRSLPQCAFERDYRRVMYLVDTQGRDPNEANIHGMTALHFAVMKESPQIIKFLMNRGANPHAKNNVGQSPLTIARETGALMFVSLMEAPGEAAAQRARLIDAIPVSKSKHRPLFL